MSRPKPLSIFLAIALLIACLAAGLCYGFSSSNLNAALLGFILVMTTFLITFNATKKPLLERTLQDARSIQRTLTLLLIVGLAVFVTSVIASNISEQEARVRKELDALTDSNSMEGWVYATKTIPKGHVIEPDEIVVIKPRGNFPKALLARKYEVVGLRTNHDLENGQLLMPDSVRVPNSPIKSVRSKSSD